MSSNEEKIALEWIKIAESDAAKIREQDIYPKLNSWVASCSPKNILEIGCGQGICSDKINFQNYTGIDSSKILLQRAKELYGSPQRKFEFGNALQIPFTDQTFDAAFSVAVWHLLEDSKKAAEELSRVLKPNGNFLVITANPNAYDLWTDPYSNQKLDGCRFEGDLILNDGSALHEVLYLHSLDEITKSMQFAKMDVLKIETFRLRSAGKHQWLLLEGRKRS